MPLLPEDFTTFFGELYKDRDGNPLSPFPWQERLVKRVCEGNWPACIAVSTASGKTACIDIAVFALACQVGLGDRRTAPRRIFFVVDRRVIVDEAFQRVKNLVNELRQAHAGVLKQVADRLRQLTGNGGYSPLECYELRGGIYRDNVWVRTPLQPTVICSTVDQIGSRLLFRGYGLSPLVVPVHAAMVANDSLIILDEAHCSNPFCQTVEAVERYRTWADEPLDSPFHFVVMSATPGQDFKPDKVLSLEDSDRDHPVLGPRLKASKPTQLKVAKNAKGDQSLEKLAEFIAEEAKKLVKDNIKAVGIIVNRVATARIIYDCLKTEPNRDAVLLTGRMRPYDKDRVIAEWQPRIEARPARPPLNRPVFVVATQCLEVGANLDFDALVSECASLDALRQRFGRLNRLGMRQAAPGVIVVQKAQEATSEDDPVYGEALAETWKALKSNASDDIIDMGVSTINTRIAQKMLDAHSLSAQQPDAPVMLPAYVDCWVQTAPMPCPDPDVSLFLHGTDRQTAEVQVVWRADLDDYANGDEWLKTVSLCPPALQECLPVQLHVLHKWWRGMESPAQYATDTEGVHVEDEGSNRTSRNILRRGLVWRGLEKSYILENLNALRPGDTLVLPLSTRGWDELGCVPNPGPNGESVDIAELVNARLIQQSSPAIPVLRIHERLKAGWPDWPGYQRLLAAANDPESRDDTATLREVLRELAADATCPPSLQGLLGQLAEDRRLSVTPYPGDEGKEHWRGMVLSGSQSQRNGSGTFSDEDDTASNGPQSILLTEHNHAVAKSAARSARLCGFLPESLTEDLQQAGGLHDVGKADMRFQAWLHGGNRRKAEVRGELLAKSIEMPRSSREYKNARQKSGYPRGGRHELLSVRLSECEGVLPEDPARRELILHLIGVHHGHCRPFAPVIEDATSETATFMHKGKTLKASTTTGLERLDSGVAERFWRMVRRYGWWGSAYLEAIVRLADWHVSETGAKEENKTP
jgi:CRISPR-associated endonuclease/helicase Cas3